VKARKRPAPARSKRAPAPSAHGASLTRRVTFTAEHRYWRPEWSAERNSATFGDYVRAHSHHYVCDVTVRGTVDPLTGFVVDLGELDRVLDVEVRRAFDHRNMNDDVPEFGDGKLTPTGENIARVILERVRRALDTHATVARVTVAEDATLSATVEGA
jgi:6-pyruvoyltetrahydropterin/6-carboxytetrahydropterin synthase